MKEDWVIMIKEIIYTDSRVVEPGYDQEVSVFALVDSLRNLYLETLGIPLTLNLF